MYTNDGKAAVFSFSRVLEALKHFLPSQTPIKDFIHHNSLHAFQHEKFYDGIFKAREIFGYHVTLTIQEYRNLYASGRIDKRVLTHLIQQRKGEGAVDDWMERLLKETLPERDMPRVGRLRTSWKTHYKFDLDNKVQPILFRLLCAYLDQGIALETFPIHPDGFLSSLRVLDANSLTNIFKSKRVTDLFHDDKVTIEHLLKMIVGEENYYEQYLWDQQFSHRGWSGMVATIEQAPQTLIRKRKITLQDLIHFELLLEIDALDYRFQGEWKALSSYPLAPAMNVLDALGKNDFDEVLMLWQDAFEWSYYDAVLAGIQEKYEPQEVPTKTPTFQAIFCIDERECSFRRYLEATEHNIHTYGAPGFFGVEFYFQPEQGLHLEKLCPAPVTPSFLIKESNSEVHRTHAWLYQKKAHTLWGGFLFNIVSGFYALTSLYKHLMHPSMSPAISDAFSHVGAESVLTVLHEGKFDEKTHLQIGFKIEEMVDRVEAQLQNIGLTQNFAPLVYMVAHGSSSANNPHHGAHDCGACSGRPGSVNARVFAQMANLPAVRSALALKGINIPSSTQFIAALHDTAADRIGFFDLNKLSPSQERMHLKNIEYFEAALDKNARERARRFASISLQQDIKKIRKDIEKRSVSMFEPRPELGHGSNALCIIGRRAVTSNLFLDRRAFLNSYDYKSDPNGALLTRIIKPIGPVCGGINLEYYFSRIDNHKLGAGTKLPHNVMGLIGVANSSDGDLRPGLPLQMIEVHDPVRLLVIVEQTPEIVLSVIQSSPDIYDWYANEWIQLAVINPIDQKTYVFKDQQFEVYIPKHSGIGRVDDMEHYIHQAKEMSTFTIEDATLENLPVKHLN